MATADVIVMMCADSLFPIVQLTTVSPLLHDVWPESTGWCAHAGTASNSKPPIANTTNTTRRRPAPRRRKNPQPSPRTTTSPRLPAAGDTVPSTYCQREQKCASADAMYAGSRRRGALARRPARKAVLTSSQSRLGATHGPAVVRTPCAERQALRARLDVDTRDDAHALRAEASWAASRAIEAHSPTDENELLEPGECHRGRSGRRLPPAISGRRQLTRGSRRAVSTDRL